MSRLSNLTPLELQYDLRNESDAAKRDHTMPALQYHRFSLSQAVEVKRGKLSELTGVIVGFDGEMCRIHPDGIPGVAVLIRESDINLVPITSS